MGEYNPSLPTKSTTTTTKKKERERHYLNSSLKLKAGIKIEN